jgi:hypothetical protein
MTHRKRSFTTLALIACAVLISELVVPSSCWAQEANKTQTIVAEGVGATADEAIKDALRNAVRQVVGAIVDAETLVKDDEVIEDKVLTYSDGFVKGYDEIAGSKKLKGGLHRIKIKAQVERRSVIAKLKAAKVSVNKLDGEGLFAKAVTELDAEQDAAAILKQQFKGFPLSCMTAEVIGKPEILEKSANEATVGLTVKIEPDLRAYKDFSGQLVKVLDGIAKQKGEFTAQYALKKGYGNVFVSTPETGYRSAIQMLQKWVPKYSRLNEGVFFKMLVVCIATNRTKSGGTQDCRYYILDLSLVPVFDELLHRSCECKLQLLDDEGEVVYTDRFSPVGLLNDTGNFVGTLVPSGEVLKGHQTTGAVVFVGPVFGYMNSGRLQPDKLMVPVPEYASYKRSVESIATSLHIPRKITLSLDELKSVKNAKIELVEPN